MATDTTTVGTISCDGLYAESARLRALFEPCYVLTASDLDDIVNLIYSVSSCNSDGELEQDNIVQVITVPLIEDSATLTVSTVVDAINEMPFFTIGTTEIAIFAVRHKIYSSRTTNYETYWYNFIGLGAGTYGTGYTQIDINNLLFIRSTVELEIDTDFADAPIVYDIDTDDEDSLVLPQDVVNNDSGTYEILDTADYYFYIALVEGSSRTDTPVDSGIYYLYRWVGDAGDYGIGGGDSAVLGDFLLVEIIGGEDSTVDDSSNSVLVKEYTVGYVMDESETINDAVNASFRTTFTINPNELVSFAAQRITYDASFEGTLTTEKYFWTNGVSTIDADSIETDFLLYETISVGTVTPVVSAEPVVVSLGAVNINDPATAVNDEETETWVINGSADYYFSIYYNNANTKTTDPTIISQYNLYRFTGASGTYGFGGTTAISTDFTLVLEDGDVDDTVSTGSVGTLDEVTTEGASTTNDITVGDVSITDGTYDTTLTNGNLTEDITLTLPVINGTVALISDIISSGNVVYQVKQTLTASEIAALDTTPIVLSGVSAPGAGYALFPTSMVAKLIYNGTAYDGDDYLLLRSTGSTEILYGAEILLQTASGIAVAENYNPLFGALLENTTLEFSCDDSGTVGDGSIEVTVTYQIIDVSNAV